MTQSRNIAIYALLVTAACASEKPAPREPRLPVEAAEAPSAPEAPATTSHVAIADDIRKACGLSEPEAYFAYDSSVLRGQDKDILAKIAACFTTGPLKDRELRIVGRADPRGNEEYNYALGQRRADNVKGSITSSGMPDAKVLSTSRGAIDAVGSDESGWSKDRRVDVLLGR